MMRVSKLLLAMTAMGGFIISSDSSVIAATATANLQITASVGANCTITAAAVAFGTYDPIVANASADDEGTGTVTVTCTKGTTATIGLSLGGNYLLSQRRMKLTTGADTLNYELYKDSGRTAVWGNSGSALFSPGMAPSKAARDFSVYGRITAGQDVSAGSYSDTVVATVNF